MAAVPLISAAAAVISASAAAMLSTMGLASSAAANFDLTAAGTQTVVGCSSHAVANFDLTAHPTRAQLGFTTHARAGFAWEASTPVTPILLASTADAALAWREPGYSLETRPGPQVILFDAGYRGSFQRNRNANLTLRDAVREYYAACGIELPSPGATLDIEFMRNRAIAACNGAQQILFAQSHRLDYFNRVTTSATISFAASPDSVELPKTIQGIHGPLKVTSTGLPLRKIRERTEFDNFGAYYYGETAQPSALRAYFIDSTNDGGGDNVLLTLRFWPPVLEDTGVTFDAITKPQRFENSDLIASTELQVPAKYTESIFFPLVRHFALSDPQFSREEARAEITAKYENALELLGLVQPKPPKLAKKPKDDA